MSKVWRWCVTHKKWVLSLSTFALSLLLRDRKQKKQKLEYVPMERREMDVTD